MGKYLGPKCRLCRREGTKLFLKGEVCYTSKCPLVKRKYPPGIHGLKRTGRLSEYGLQLREKQKAKRIYGILEKQFKNYFKKAYRQKGFTGENLLKLLEKRLDNVIYRAGFASSRSMARQIVNHGHILVNNHKVNIPSYQVKVNDVIKVKKTSRLFSQIKERVQAKIKQIELPSWFSVDEKNLEIKILSEPKAEDLPKDIDVRLIVEFYSK